MVNLSNATTRLPPPFKVYSASGRYVGYGVRTVDGYEIFFPGGEVEGYCGSIRGSDVFFSSDEVAGQVRQGHIFYGDGKLAGRLEGASVVCDDGTPAGRVEGDVPEEAAGGAVLLLILNRWFDAEGKPNPGLA